MPVVWRGGARPATRTCRTPPASSAAAAARARPARRERSAGDRRAAAARGVGARRALGRPRLARRRIGAGAGPRARGDGHSAGALALARPHLHRRLALLVRRAVALRRALRRPRAARRRGRDTLRRAVRLVGLVLGLLGLDRPRALPATRRRRRLSRGARVRGRDRGRARRCHGDSFGRMLTALAAVRGGRRRRAPLARAAPGGPARCWRPPASCWLLLPCSTSREGARAQGERADELAASVGERRRARSRAAGSRSPVVRWQGALALTPACERRRVVPSSAVGARGGGRATLPRIPGATRGTPRRRPRRDGHAAARGERFDLYVRAR